VLVAGAISRVVPAVWLERAGGAFMLVLGAWVLWKSR